MNNELKVSFYIKREKSATNACGIYPVIGKIIVGSTLAQFSSKLKVDERLWDVKSGRATGKSRQAVELNRAINRINLAIHASYKDILKRTGKVTAVEVKNAFQGVATAQTTVIALFEEMMRDFKARTGIDRAESTYKQYEVLHDQLERLPENTVPRKRHTVYRTGLAFHRIFGLLFQGKAQNESKNRQIKARAV